MIFLTICVIAFMFQGKWWPNYLCREISFSFLFLKKNHLVNIIVSTIWDITHACLSLFDSKCQRCQAKLFQAPNFLLISHQRTPAPFCSAHHPNPHTGLGPGSFVPHSRRTPFWTQQHVSDSLNLLVRWGRKLGQSPWYNLVLNVSGVPLVLTKRWYGCAVSKIFVGPWV